MEQTDKYIWKIDDEDVARCSEGSGVTAPGWYFQNECEGLEGPYSSRQEAIDAMDAYAKQL